MILQKHWNDFLANLPLLRKVIGINATFDFIKHKTVAFATNFMLSKWQQ